jgi:hypothetical protein
MFAQTIVGNTNKKLMSYYLHISSRDSLKCFKYFIIIMILFIKYEANSINFTVIYQNDIVITIEMYICKLGLSLALSLSLSLPLSLSFSLTLHPYLFDHPPFIYVAVFLRPPDCISSEFKQYAYFKRTQLSSSEILRFLW